PRGQYSGVEAVIHKDRTAALLGLGLDTDLVVFLTGVDQVQTDFGTPHANTIEQLTASQARKLLNAGQFPAGSMGPKIEAAVDFVQRSTKPSSQAMITSREQIE